MYFSPFATGVAVVTGAVVLPVAIPLAVGAAGFGTGGIVAGTWGASLMATYGGAVAAGSACATLQSIGVVGLGVSGTAFASIIGAATTGAVVVGVNGVKGEQAPIPRGSLLLSLRPWSEMERRWALPAFFRS